MIQNFCLYWNYKEYGETWPDIFESLEWEWCGGWGEDLISCLESKLAQIEAGLKMSFVIAMEAWDKELDAEIAKCEDMLELRTLTELRNGIF